MLSAIVSLQKKGLLKLQTFTQTFKFKLDCIAQFSTKRKIKQNKEQLYQINKIMLFKKC